MSWRDAASSAPVTIVAESVWFERRALCIVAVNEFGLRPSNDCLSDESTMWGSHQRGSFDSIVPKCVSLSALGALVSLIALAFQWWSVAPREFDAVCYNQPYARIANVPYLGENAPGGYRLLTPTLVHYLPFSLPTGFAVIHLPALFLAGWFLVLISREMGVRGLLPIIAPIPFLLSSGVHWQLRDGFLCIDAMSWLLLAAVVYAFLRGRDDWVCCLSVLGVLNRESALFFLPIWYVCRFGWSVHRRSVSHLLRTWGPAIAMFFVIRYVWHPLTGYSRFFEQIDSHPKGYLEFYLEDFFKINPSLGVFLERVASWRTLNTIFGTLLPLFFVGLIRGNRFYRRLSLLVLVVWGQLFVAGDLGRLDTYMFPVLIPLSFLTFQKLIKGWRYSLLAEVGMAVVLILFPQSFPAGLALVLAGFAVHLFLVPKQEISTLRVEPDVSIGDTEGGREKLVNSTRWKKPKAAPWVLCAAAFVWLCVFAIQTVSLRPKPMLSLPPSLNPSTSPVWEITCLLDGLLRSATIDEDNFPPMSWLQIGQGTHPESVIFPLGSPPPDTLIFSLTATAKEREELTIGTTQMTADGIVLRTTGTITVNPYPDMYKIVVFPAPQADGLYLGTDPDSEWSGHIQAVLYDVSEIAARCKNKARL